MTHINPRDLIQRLAKELDRYRQIALDDRTSTHPLADEARAYLAQAEPDGPAVLDSREPASVTAYPTSSMSELSPAAQAVLDAVVDGALPPFHVIARPMAAAALRAAVKQCTYRDAWEDKFLSAERILAIAAELETND